MLWQRLHSPIVDADNFDDDNFDFDDNFDNFLDLAFLFDFEERQ